VLFATVALAGARPAGAATCLVVTCPPGVSQAVTGAQAVIPGLGAATSVIGSVAGALGDAATSIAQGVLEQIGQGIADAVGRLYSEVSAFLSASSSPQVTLSSFVAGNGAYHQVAELGVLAMIGFMFLAVISGVVAGDPLGHVGRMLRSLPFAVLAIVGFPWAVDQLIGLVDAVCASLLPTGATLGTIVAVYAADQVRATVGGFGLPAIVTELLVFAAGVLLYAELVVRAALVTIVVALAPLSFAAMVWPAARGAARKAVELVVAIVLSKLAIWVALDVGISLFAAHAQAIIPGGQAWGQMISGAAIIAVAVFAPFVVWRLLPVAEAAVVAQGLARTPGRAGMQAAQTATMLRGRGGSGGGGGEASEHPALADLPSRSLDLAGPTTADAIPVGSGGSAGAASGAGAAGAVAGPAVAVIEAGRAVRDHVVGSADAQTTTAHAQPAERTTWGFGPPGPDAEP
jgi:hypothetical protein